MLINILFFSFNLSFIIGMSTRNLEGQRENYVFLPYKTLGKKAMLLSGEKLPDPKVGAFLACYSPARGLRWLEWRAEGRGVDMSWER